MRCFRSYYSVSYAHSKLICKSLERESEREGQAGSMVKSLLVVLIPCSEHFNQVKKWKQPFVIQGILSSLTKEKETTCSMWPVLMTSAKMG